MAGIAILGYGTVGSGVYQILDEHRALIAQRAGEAIDVMHVLDLRDFPGDPAERVLTKAYDKILADERVSVIVETLGGVEPAYSYVKSALMNGKSVCTSNKELVAEYGAELLQLAADYSVNFLFEASVGGGIPIIRPLYSALCADEIYEIEGILNGTTNYILTKMLKENMDFETALKKAQDKGYAESNPDADVKGYDACRKIAILSSLAYGQQVDYNDVFTRGIEKVSQKGMRYAAKMGGVIKLIGYSRKDENGVFLRVTPLLLMADHPLAAVENVFNAILVRGKMTGDVMFYGKGAGKLPTASAVVADVMDCARNKEHNIGYQWSPQKLSLISLEESKVKCLLRFAYEDKEALMVNVHQVFGECEIVDLDEEDGELGVITAQMTEKEIKDKTNQLGALLLGKLRIAL